MTTKEILLSAKAAVPVMATVTGEKKNEALINMAQALEDGIPQILAANEKDVENARAKYSAVMIDRLTLTADRIRGMAQGIREVAALPDPVGKELARFTRPNGLEIKKVSVPMGVIAMIYESRPNVTSDAAALTLKSGSVSVLRSGKEAILTSGTIVEVMRKGLEKSGLPGNLINILEDTSRESANELMTARGLVDLLIPRGGKGLISSCVENATVPCIETGTGICHIYIDESADIEKALNIVENAKTSRPSVCNAEEVLLVDKKVAEKFLPALKKRLVDDRTAKGLTPVELRCDGFCYEIIGGKKADENDFDTEFLDYILAVAAVDGVTQAIGHIAEHSTHHSDCIVTENAENAALFTALTDSAAVYVNASTRFTDGGEFGLGCEIGISTQKLHARGPMGLEELTTTKYIITGDGQIR